VEKMMEIRDRDVLSEIQKKSKYKRLINWRKTHITRHNVCYITLNDVSHQECIVISLDTVNPISFDRKLSEAFTRVIKKAEEVNYPPLKRSCVLKWGLVKALIV